MKIHLISGFLGSGKTTAIQAACNELSKQGRCAAVIMNDQGTRLVDADFFTSLGVPGRQVIDGCFCCNYNQLDSNVQSLLDDENPDVIFAESVGSCTDIVATVLKPLLTYRPGTPVTLSVFADLRLLHILLSRQDVFDDSVSYIYFKQLEEAAIIIVNKTDLASEQQLLEVKDIMQSRYGNKILVYQNSLDPLAILQWLSILDANPGKGTLPSLSIDYDIYGAGEAKLAWLDEELEVHNPVSGATLSSQNLIRSIHRKIDERRLPVGHLKFLLNKKDKISFVQGASQMLTDISGTDSEVASLLINARVQTDPETLSQLVKEAIMETEKQDGSTITVGTSAVFQPGYPAPTHRFAN